jgi:hypothetical protein
MSLLTDIFDRALGAGASTTLVGSGTVTALYSLVEKFFPKASDVVASAHSDPTQFIVGLALILAGMIWHKPVVTLADDEPQ